MIDTIKHHLTALCDACGGGSDRHTQQCHWPNCEGACKYTSLRMDRVVPVVRQIKHDTVFAALEDQPA
jgi:hypothetical protein